MLLTVHGWPPKPEYINARQLRYVINWWNNMSVNCIFCYDFVKYSKHHTMYNNSSRSILIAKSEYMARISNDFYELLLLIHWNFGDIFLEKGPVYWYMAEHLSRKIGKCVYIASCYRFSCYYRFSDIAINCVNPSFIWRLEFSKNG